jgi:hypothetical protein
MKSLEVLGILEIRRGYGAAAIRDQYEAMRSLSGHEAGAVE